LNFSYPILPAPKSTAGQKFGVVRTGSSKAHTGLDMGTGGDKVLAAADGIVTASTLSTDSRGRLIYLKHDDEYQTRYYHLDSALVKKDDAVKQGEQIAVAGKTGLPNPWPHLHFEILKNGVQVDPEKYLKSSASNALALLIGAGVLYSLLRLM
jgi:murein DD-endopeptidase MepM/ murein hydrolase activator NlpD